MNDATPEHDITNKTTMQTLSNMSNFAKNSIQSTVHDALVFSLNNENLVALFDNFQMLFYVHLEEEKM